MARARERESLPSLVHKWQWCRIVMLLVNLKTEMRLHTNWRLFGKLGRLGLGPKIGLEIGPKIGPKSRLSNLKTSAIALPPRTREYKEQSVNSPLQNVPPTTILLLLR